MNHLATIPPPDRLTPHQRNILRCLARGWSNVEIADELGYAPRTIKNRCAALLHIIGVQTRTQAAILAWHAGLADEEIE